MTDAQRDSQATQIYEPMADGATLAPTSPGTPGAVSADEHALVHEHALKVAEIGLIALRELIV